MTTLKEKVGDKTEESQGKRRPPSPVWAGMWATASVLVFLPPETGCVALGKELNLSGLALQITILLTQRQGVAK